MSARNGVLLTGATGMLGRYLLRDLLAAGRPVAVLVRPTVRQTATERIGEVIAFWSDVLGQTLPQPQVLEGELGGEKLDLSAADREWLRRHCGLMLHAAADLKFYSGSSAEPWRTNVEGTRALLDACSRLGIAEWHHVSTAYVCGRRQGIIAEEDFKSSQEFHNDYERSKFEAERLVRRAKGVQATIYRPAVVVGDSRTGYTSAYHGFYRFLELASRLADAQIPQNGGVRTFKVRLPLTGDELCHLVPVDWVSRAIRELIQRPRWHGRTFHLAAIPTTSKLIHEVAAAELRLSGITLANAARATGASLLEQLFLDGMREYWPYLRVNSPTFDCSGTRAALPDLEPPAVDRALLTRLIRFAVADDWGGRSRGQANPRRGNRAVLAATPERIAPAEYLEVVFPRQARQSALAQIARLSVTVGIDIRGPLGGQWTIQWLNGELGCTRPGLDSSASVIYRLDVTTFDAIIRGELSPQLAFFEQRIEIAGDVEMALKLAVMFGQFLAENPHARPGCKEAKDRPVPSV